SRRRPGFGPAVRCCGGRSPVGMGPLGARALGAPCSGLAPWAVTVRAGDEPPVPAQAVPSAPIATPPESAEADSPDPHLQLSWSDGLLAETADRAFRVHIGGRFDFDSGWGSAPANIQNNLASPLLDGTDFRRFRLGADGIIYQQVVFAIEADFSKASDVKPTTTGPVTNIFITNAWVAVHDLPVLDIIRV